MKKSMQIKAIRQLIVELQYEKFQSERNGLAKAALDILTEIAQPQISGVSEVECINAIKYLKEVQGKTTKLGYDDVTLELIIDFLMRTNLSQPIIEEGRAKS
jgi:hypothetical protein